MNLIELTNITHKEIIFKQHGSARMILAYHTLGNGVCFGGVRLASKDDWEKGLKDALRLSEAMTYKLALIDAPYGGCKAVVFTPESGKTKEFLRDVGRLIEEEHGKFISAIDFGFEPDDAKIIKETTNYILAIKDSEFGQSGVTTACGVLVGIKATLKQVFGSDAINGKSFAVQGLGSVGQVLAEELVKAGGKVYVSDLDANRLKEFENISTLVNPNEILYLDVDVLAPCGPAYIINENSIPKLKCKIIAGAANCQLEDETEDDRRLFERGILVAPDYVINAGGVLQGIEELNGGSLENALSKLSVIAKNLNEVYSRSKQSGEGTYAIAKKMVLEKFKKIIPSPNPESA